MYRGLVVCVLAVYGAALSPQGEGGLFELNVMHYNDFHANFDEISSNGGICEPGDAACVGGYARLCTAIRQGLETDPDSLVLNGGDTFQGSVWYKLLRWNVTSHFMNLIPHDAHVLGNHELDDGPEGLLPYLETLAAPMLGANVNATFEPALAPYIKNHVLVERNGRKIGIIGVLKEQFSAPRGGIIMEDAVEAVNREAAILTDQGVDIIIVMAHTDVALLRRLGELVSPTVDFIVGGHPHNLLPNPNGDTVIGEYPIIVTRTDGHKIPFVLTSSYCQYLGIIKLYFDDTGALQKWDGQPLFLSSSITKDRQIMEVLDTWRKDLDAIAKEVMGVSLVVLQGGQPCWRGECNLGSWMCDAFLEEVTHHAKSANEKPADVCLALCSGLRSKINAGNVTKQAMMTSLPYDNYVQVFDLNGKYLLEVLEYSLSNIKNRRINRNLQIGGMRNVYNASAPAGSRVVSALVRCVQCDEPRYEPLDVNKTYRVVTTNFLGDGGSGFTVGLHFLLISTEMVKPNLSFIIFLLLKNVSKRARKISKVLMSE